jgi:hypothetical protein
MALPVASVLNVRCANCGPDVWQAVFGVLGGVGGLAAVIALIFAIRSAKDARASLRVAESTVEAAKSSALASERAAAAAERSEALGREMVTTASDQLAALESVKWSVGARAKVTDDPTQS